MTDMDVIKDMNSKSSLFKQGFMFGLGYLTDDINGLKKFVVKEKREC